MSQSRPPGEGPTQEDANWDAATVADFGREWAVFDQARLSAAELTDLFERYFELFPWHELPPDPVGFDLGCGSGRWALGVAPRVKALHCIDASPEAIEVAARNLGEQPNCVLHVASVDAIPLQRGSMDFGYSLGVLHHVPDTAAGIRACVEPLKGGAPLLLYLYYAFDQRPRWFRTIWKFTDVARRLISRSPHLLKLWLTTGIATVIYLPLARFARLRERLGADVERIPLSTYRRSSFYTMRTDALDRFGTRLEHRFTAAEIRAMMEAAGLERVAFSEQPPFWRAVGYKVPDAPG
jgi:SAM-dependent methyltransferase